MKSDEVEYERRLAELNPSIALAERVALLEAENAELRRQPAELDAALRDMGKQLATAWIALRRRDALLREALTRLGHGDPLEAQINEELAK